MTGATISSTMFNAMTADYATGLSTCIAKDGQTATTARIPFLFGISATLTTDATSISTGSIIASGGIGCTKALWVGGLANIAGAVTLQSTLTVATSIALGATPATAGLIGIPHNNLFLRGRNNANSANAVLMSWGTDGNDMLSLGYSADPQILFIYGLKTTDPAAPPANSGVVYFKDNGSGKTQLVVKFNSGAVQVIATQP